MRWTRGHRSEDVEDRRGETTPGGMRGMRVGGGIGLGGAVVLLVLSLVFGQNFFALLEDGGGVDPAGGPGGPAPSAPARKAGPAEEQAAGFMAFVLDDVQNTWTREFTRGGREYERAKLVLFTDAVRSGCGGADASVGPFYCPADHKVYIDLSFYEELKNRFGAPGDFAQAYVLAHEIGHHVQNLLGVSDQVRASQQARPDQAVALSVRLELQADCLAGIWARSTEERQLLEEGDIEEALGAASAVGDDRIQRQSRGRVTPETWTHGSARQRSGWFRRGLESGRVQDCDTFRIALPGVEDRAPLRSR